MSILLLKTREAIKRKNECIVIKDIEMDTINFSTLLYFFFTVDTPSDVIFQGRAK